MTIIIRSEGSETHKATEIIIDGNRAAWMTPSSSHPDDTSVDLSFHTTGAAWVAIKILADEGVHWTGEAVR